MPVEVVLHLGREVVVDEPPEVLLQEVDHGEGQEGRTSAVPFLNTYPRSRIVPMIDAYVDGRPISRSSSSLTSDASV